MFRDFLKVIGASVGWVAEVSLQVAKAYLRFLQKAIVPSLVLGGIAAGALLYSEASQIAGFNVLGVLLIGAVLLFWLIAAQPVVEGVTVLGETAKPVKRICDRMISAVLVIGVLLLTSMHMPAGVAGLQRIGVLIVFLSGAVLLGFQITRKTIGVKLIIIAVLMAASFMLPGAFSSLGSILPAADVKLKNAMVPENTEIELTLDSIAGHDPSAPRLFVDGESNWYCRSATESGAGYRCFHYPGTDDVTNEPLIPITPKIIHDIKVMLLAKSRAKADSMAQDEAIRKKAIEDMEAKEGSAKKGALLRKEAERRMQTEAAQAEWRSFEAGVRSNDSSWNEKPSWRNDIDGKQVRIQYTDRRRVEALEIASRLNALGATVKHIRVTPAHEESFSHLIYSFSNYEAADAIRQVAFQTARLELLSSDSGVRQIEIVLQ